MQKIQLTKGCPNHCSYCYEPQEVEIVTPISELKIISNQVQVLDMNFLANPHCKQAIRWLGEQRVNNKVIYYELVCGIDFRILDQETANLLKESRFIKVRWAWDYGFASQRKHRDTLLKLVRAGYDPKSLSVFILTNWKIPYVDCVKKLDLLKVWNVKVNDCCFDGGYAKAKPKDWDIDQVKRFRKMCRKHNQIVNFGIDPEY